VPGVALLTEDAPATVSVETAVRETASGLVAPVGSWCGRVEVLHLHGKRLQLLQRRLGARGLEELPQAFWLYQANVAEFLSFLREDVAAALSNLVEFIIEPGDVVPAL
jgi:hypothetical protein